MGKKDSVLDFNSLDIEKEASSLISEMKDIAEYLIDPPKKDEDKKSGKGNNKNGNGSSSDSDSENNSENDNENQQGNSDKNSSSQNQQDNENEDENEGNGDNNNSKSSSKNKDKQNGKGKDSDSEEEKDSNSEGKDGNKNDGEEEKDNKSNGGKSQQSPQQQQRNQSNRGNGQKDPQQELKDALDELQSLLDSKTSKDKQQGQQSGGDSNGEGQQGGGQQSGGSGGGGGGALPPGIHVDPVNMSSPPDKGKVKFRGIDIDLNNLPQDLKEDKDDENKTEREKEYLAEEFIRQAINEFKAHSPNGGGRMLTLFEESVKPAPPKWVNILNPYLRPDNNIQWLWNKAHRNRLTMANGGKVLFRGANRPKEKLKNLCIALDNSGSIDQEDFRKFYSTVKGFLDVRKNVQGWVCWWDAEEIDLNAPNQGPFKNYKEFKQVKAYGGGGTDPTVALEYAKKRDCKYVIIFTDGYFDFPNKKWESEFVKVIWVIAKKEDFENFDCKWGIKAI